MVLSINGQDGTEWCKEKGLPPQQLIKRTILLSGYISQIEHDKTVPAVADPKTFQMHKVYGLSIFLSTIPSKNLGS